MVLYAFKSAFDIELVSTRETLCIGTITQIRLINIEYQQHPLLIVDRADWEKSAYQQQKEQALLEELVSVVNKRDALVLAIDQQQIRYADFFSTELRFCN